MLRTGVVGMVRQSGHVPASYRRGRHLHARPATEADVEPGSTPQPNRPAFAPCALGSRARLRPRLPVSRPESQLPQWAAPCLPRSASSMTATASSASCAGRFSLASFPSSDCSRFAARKDVERFKEMKYGRLLKGPVLRLAEGLQSGRQRRWRRLQNRRIKQLMRIPQRAEGQHIELMGDTGAGKTRLIMQLLLQIRERGHSAIVYDPACEFVQRFYDNRSRRHHPESARCPLPLLGAVRGAAPPRRGQGHRRVAVPADDGQEGRVFHRDAAENLRPSADLRPHARRSLSSGWRTPTRSTAACRTRRWR